MMVTYEQMTLTERAEAHILSARTMMGQANAMLQQASSRLGVTRDQEDTVIAAAAAIWAGAQVEATLAVACAQLAANEGARPAPRKVELG